MLLRAAVDCRGATETVCRTNQWAEHARDGTEPSEAAASARKWSKVGRPEGEICRVKGIRVAMIYSGMNWEEHDCSYYYCTGEWRMRGRGLEGEGGSDRHDMVAGAEKRANEY